MAPTSHLSILSPSLVMCAGLCLHSPSGPTSAGYPEQYLARCKLPKVPLRSIIAQGCSSLPSALHASAQQLYIVLYFLPEALHGENDLMKALVARYFSHSWVLPWAPGHFADLSLHWQGYRAARNALGAVVNPAAAKQLAATHGATALPLQRRRTQQFQDKIANVSLATRCCLTGRALCSFSTVFYSCQAH